MKKLLLSLTLAGLLALALGGATSAHAGSPSVFGRGWAIFADMSTPSVSAVNPASAPNDIDTHVTITGAGFATDATGTVAPTASLGSTPLTHVTLVNGTTLTATVPWGIDPGVYPLTVVNPDGGTATLANAFTVTLGVGQWNGGNLFGGQVPQILMKPGDPNTLYALAYGIAGLFRSEDAGEHWTHVGVDVHINNGKFAIDPLHPDWLYGFVGCNNGGLCRSQDGGNTWTRVMPNAWPDGRSMNSPQVFVSPHDPQVLFVSASSAYGDPFATGAYGLIKSTDGGVSWKIVADMEGIPAQSVAFDPADSSKMVLATSDGQVYQSSDGGDHWSEVAKPPISSLGMRGSIAYNPDRPTEVWIASSNPGGIYKSTDATLTDWKDVSPAAGVGSTVVTFTGADSVYINRYHSEDGGKNWQSFGPSPWYGDGAVIFDPNDPQIGYIGDNAGGVQKTTDGGQTWQIKNQGLKGMLCYSLEVSRADPLRVFAACADSPPGIYRSNDGAGNWTHLPIASIGNGVGAVREDPFDPQRLYAPGDGLYVSTDGGESWSDLGWNLPPSSPAGMRTPMEPDPFHAGHLLLGVVSGNYGVGGTSWLYSSSDYGVSWQAVTMPQHLAWIKSIAFDPETPGLVYLVTNGTGVFRSTDSGTSWGRIDDPQQPDMQYLNSIAIATHPRHVLIVASDRGPYRSFDGGATWERTLSYSSGGSDFMFADRDSDRLYFGTATGLFSSSDAGDSWERAAGALGTLQIMALSYADADGHTILYAATSGGAAGVTNSTTAATRRASTATASTIRYAAAANGLVDAGIYRYVVMPTPPPPVTTPTTTTPAITTTTTTPRSGSPRTTTPAPGGKIASCKLSKKSFRGSQAGKVKLSCKFSPKSKLFAYVLSLKKVKKWALVKSARKTGSFKTYTLTVKKLFAGKPIKRGSYRLKLSAARNSKTLGFKIT